MSRRFVTLDVFTHEPLAGNPLAVVLDAEGLDSEPMQRIAREFNLSETVFVSAPESDRHRAALRIFTPKHELPFAGHPTVGTAVLLAIRDRHGEPGAVVFGLEEKVGVVSCAVDVLGQGRGQARFRVPRLPEPWGEGLPSAQAAWALGLDPMEIGFDRHVPSRHFRSHPWTRSPGPRCPAKASTRCSGTPRTPRSTSMPVMATAFVRACSSRRRA